ncbi:MAG: hypothetical protein JST90_10145 [Bacteroidetes bacterium]|nr:hypothetical protein [Bacteroidota bacterium]
MKIVLLGALALLAHTCTAQAKVTPPAKPTNMHTQPVKAATAPAGKDSATAAKLPVKPKAVEYADIDLDTVNPPLPFLIKAPVGSAVTFDQGVVITAPDTTFAIIIDMSYTEMPATIAQRRKDAQDNPMSVFSKFIIDKPEALLYEANNMGKKEYHFEVARDIRGERYYIHDQGVDGRSFTQKQIEAMMKAASEAHPKQ